MDLSFVKKDWTNNFIGEYRTEILCRNFLDNIQYGCAIESNIYASAIFVIRFNLHGLFCAVITFGSIVRNIYFFVQIGVIP